MINSSNEGQSHIGTLPRSFNYINKNKIRLLVNYIGKDKAFKKGIGPHYTGFTTEMEDLIAQRMECDIGDHEASLKRRALTSQKTQVDDLMGYLES